MTALATGAATATPVPAERPARAGALSATLTFGARAVLRLRRVPEQMTDAIAIPVLFTLLFTYLFGGAMAGSPGRYLTYLLPGTLVMSVLLVTVYSGIGLATDRARGALDRFRTLPVWRPALVVGGLLGDTVRYLVAAVLVVGMGLAMGYRPHGGVGGTLAGLVLILLFGYCLSWLWTTLGLLVRNPTTVTLLSFIVQIPLTFASNVFVDPATMPGWLRAFVSVNPVSHLVSAERGLLSGTVTAGQLGWVFAACAGLLAVFAPSTMVLYRRLR